MFLTAIKDQAPAALCSHKIINLIQSCCLFEGVVNTDLLSSLQTLEPGAYPGFSPLSPPEQTTPVQPRNPELEQRAKAMRGRMWVHQHSGSPSSVRAAALPAAAMAVSSAVVKNATFFCSGLFWTSWFRRRRTTSKTWASWWRWATNTFTLTLCPSYLFCSGDVIAGGGFSSALLNIFCTERLKVLCACHPDLHRGSVPLLDCSWKLIGFMADNFHLSFQTIL